MRQSGVIEHLPLCAGHPPPLSQKATVSGFICSADRSQSSHQTKTYDSHNKHRPYHLSGPAIVDRVMRWRARFLSLARVFLYGSSSSTSLWSRMTSFEKLGQK